jgi:uncharacterized phiE125 gp8 family phage protein
MRRAHTSEVQQGASDDRKKRTGFVPGCEEARVIEADPMILPAEALAEAKSYLRVEGAREDALIGGAVLSAADLCERFTGEVLLRRAFRERLPASGAWTRLGRRPVLSISGIERLDPGGPSALPPSAFAVDIDASGAGWVRLVASDARQVRATYSCGLAAGWTDVPEPLRHGIIRLAAHLYTHRSGDDDRGPPAAVTALWRPYRRLRLA